MEFFDVGAGGRVDEGADGFFESGVEGWGGITIRFSDTIKIV